MYEAHKCCQNPNRWVDACEDFFVLVIHSHIIAAAMEQLGMSTVNDYPTKLINARTIWTQKSDDREKILCKSISNILDTFTSISYNISVPADEDSVWICKVAFKHWMFVLRTTKYNKERGQVSTSEVLQIFTAYIHKFRETELCN